MKNKEEFSEIIANNLIYYRKKVGFTQLELAEKLNYSDKTISKWERKESLPDIHTLYELCTLYNITLNDLIYKKKNLKKVGSVINKKIIMILSVSLVWLLATTTFVALLMFFESLSYKWLTFIYALPVSFIVLLVLSLLWQPKKHSLFYSSLLVITLFVSLSLSLHLLLGLTSAWFLVLLIIPLEILIHFWFLLKRNMKK